MFNVVGAEFIRDELQQPGYFFKAILNDSGIAFFTGKTEHRTVKICGLSYEDNYQGNALAAVITEGRIEIRNHVAFSPERVVGIVKKLLSCSEIQDLKDFTVTYQGNRIR